jgi:NAD-dependent SIR2 family protein deacetylase
MEESRLGRHCRSRDTMDNGRGSLNHMRCLSCWAVFPQNVVISGEQEITPFPCTDSQSVPITATYLICGQLGI